MSNPLNETDRLQDQGNDQNLQDPFVSDGKTFEFLYGDTTTSEPTTMIPSEPPLLPESVSESEKPFVHWILAAAVLGCLFGILLSQLVSVVKRKRTEETDVDSVKVVTVQGLGAREDQQDSVLVTDPELYKEQGVLICVADGMGGLKNGAMISRTAVTAANNKFNAIEKTDPDRMLAAILQSTVAAVNMIISPDYGAGGTTLLLGYAAHDRFFFTTVGDSRICLCRNGELYHLNRPHVFEDELLLRYFNGEISYDNARGYEKRGALTSYLGMGPLKYVDFPTHHLRLQKGDRIILMSDGVFGTLTDEELVEVLSLKTKAITKVLSQEIETKQKRFQDNYSAAILIVE